VRIAVGESQTEIGIEALCDQGPEFQLQALVIHGSKVAEVLRAGVGVEHEEIGAMGLRVVEIEVRAEPAVEEFRLGAGLVSVRRFFIEEIVDAGNACGTHAGLVETAAAKAPAVTDVQRRIRRGLVTQGDLRLQLIPALSSHLAGKRDSGERRGDELDGRIRCVLALVIVVAQGERKLGLVVDVEVRLAEDRPGEVILRVREERELRVEQRQRRPAYFRYDTCAEIEDIARGNEPIGRNGVGSNDPAQPLLSG